MYRSQEPDIPWIDALDFHFQHGVVVSTPELFVMARPVRLADGDDEHLALSVPRPADEADGLHVWMAAGTMRGLLAELRRLPWVKGVTFVRADGRVRRWFLKH
ncbi:hypothetical protein [Luteolibacter sp. LG18]|uniref:hypothetical protein n=1 Tax=Luteolibacter sp. LG18 TaxID=2819286 RepID=UPI002B293C44|nr:hypothetical protein llg_26960 [Luteolibacter sp. LG18]